MMTNTSDKRIQLVKGLPLVICFFFGAFAVFYSIWKHNYGAATSALYLEFVCSILLRLNAQAMKNQLQEKTSLRVLRAFKGVGLVGTFLFLVLGFVYIYLAVSNKQDFHWEQEGYYVAAIPTFLGCFWSSILFFDCRKFESSYGAQGGVYLN